VEPPYEQDDAAVFDLVVRDGERTPAQGHFKRLIAGLSPAAFPAAMETMHTGDWKFSLPHRSSINTNRRPLMSESYSLPTEPEGMVATLVERFNSGKVAAMMSLYSPEAVFIAKDGRTITDHTEIAAELERDLKLGLPLEAKARHVFVADNIAQIVLD
jgi:hypothetical protein